MQIETQQTWYNFYKNKVNNKYYNYITNRYKPFIDEIKKEIKNNNYIIEMGCGLGNITKSLLKTYPHCRYKIIDNDSKIIYLAIDHLDAIMVEWDLFDITMPFPYNQNCDIIHSHGVLEHFSDSDISEILQNQLKVSPILIHYVPSNKYNYKSFGDERLLSKEYWMKHFSPSEIIEFNNGYDLILKWRR